MAFQVTLVSMPWFSVDRPSIQLAVLKAWLESRLGRKVEVKTRHVYLGVASALGPDLYRQISGRIWPAEAVYAPLLFPEVEARADALFRRKARPGSDAAALEPTWARRRIEEHLEESGLLEELGRADLVGFSLCIAQLTSSLYLLRRLKQAHPAVRTVLGGNLVTGELGRSLMVAFPEVDFVVNGEGELPLLHLVETLSAGRDPAEEPVAGVFHRDAAGAPAGGGMQQIRRLEDLPIPDYDDYFDTMALYPELGVPAGPVPVEGSRGCWWSRVRSDGTSRGCEFCNFNMQWTGYRKKPVERTARELEMLADRHQVVNFVFLDNIQPRKGAERLFETIERSPVAYKLFAELRAPLDAGAMRTMRAAGLRRAQIGIEALSTSLLEKINKGVRAIDNVHIMKLCEEYGIESDSNLLLQFPGSDRRDVEETLRVLEFVRWYQPLMTVEFWLGEGSGVSQRPEAFGVSNMRNHPYYGAFFPREILNGLTLMHKDYDGAGEFQERLWRPVVEGVRQWREEYERVQRSYPTDPHLGYLDGGSFLLIHRRGAGSGRWQTRRLKGPERNVYLFCNGPKPLDEVASAFPDLHPDDLRRFLREMEADRLMFREDDVFLGLAVNEDIRRFCPACAGGGK